MKVKKSLSSTPSFYRWKSQGSEVKGLASSFRFSFHYSRPANSSLLFIETVLLGHSPPICLGLLYGCFHMTRAEWSSCDRAQIAYKPKIFTLWSFTENVCIPVLDQYDCLVPGFPFFMKNGQPFLTVFCTY